MKVLKTNSFISERIKIRPITNAEFDKVQKELERPENPFGITEKDLTGDIKYFPMGIAVRMLEEQQMQGNTPDVTVFQKIVQPQKLKKVLIGITQKPDGNSGIM